MNDPSASEEPSTREQHQGRQAVNLGLNFAAAMGLLTFLGYKMDEKRGGGQGFTMTGAVLGLVYGAYEVWKLVRTPPGEDDGKDA